LVSSSPCPQADFRLVRSLDFFSRFDPLGHLPYLVFMYLVFLLIKGGLVQAWDFTLLVFSNAFDSSCFSGVLPSLSWVLKLFLPFSVLNIVSV
jgi:hypothetical protein